VQNDPRIWPKLLTASSGIINNLNFLGVCQNNYLVYAVKFCQNTWRILFVCHVITNRMMICHFFFLIKIKVYKLKKFKNDNFFLKKKIKEKRKGVAWEPPTLILFFFLKK